MADKIYFLNTRFDRMCPEEAVELLLARALRRQNSRVYYANANTMVVAAKNSALVEALKQSDLLLADGSGVCWGSALLGTPLNHNLNGTDLVPALCNAGSSKGLSVYLLGAKPGVAEEAAANLAKAHPGLIIAGVQHGYFHQQETQKILEVIRASRPHLLLVGMGVPLQEIWLNQYASQLPGIISMGVGGLFDFLAKRVVRAPYLIRTIGMEWLWRLAMEPSRLWKRYIIGNFVFCSLVAEHFFSSNSSKRISARAHLNNRFNSYNQSIQTQLFSSEGKNRNLKLSAAPMLDRANKQNLENYYSASKTVKSKPACIGFKPTSAMSMRMNTQIKQLSKKRKSRPESTSRHNKPTWINKLL